MGVDMSTTRLTTTDEIELADIDMRAGIDTCPACRHPRDSHDATSQRFCAATLSMGVGRRCICRVDGADGETDSDRAASSHRFGYASTLPRGA